MRVRVRTTRDVSKKRWRRYVYYSNSVYGYAGIQYIKLFLIFMVVCRVYVLHERENHIHFAMHEANLT